MTIFYIGSTSDLVGRLWEHKNEVFLGSFTQKYGVKILVYYEEYLSMDEALAREKQLKHWKRSWKIEIIKKCNPQLKDLEELWNSDILA